MFDYGYFLIGRCPWFARPWFAPWFVPGFVQQLRSELFPDNLNINIVLFIIFKR
jgi:hypothetical protein